MDELNIKVTASDQFIELMALKAECEGMRAENLIRQELGRQAAYGEVDFSLVAYRMRSLKIGKEKSGEDSTA